MVKETGNERIKKYEADLLQDVIGVITDIDKSKNDIKLTYTAKAGKYELVVRSKED